jgi:hypothetical protein
MQHDGQRGPERTEANRQQALRKGRTAQGTMLAPQAKQ